MATQLMKVAMLVLTSMVFMTSPVTSMQSLNHYKSCLYECLHCVSTWGKELFNGELCAHNCHITKGDSIDSTCRAYFTRSVRQAST
jgi:hypothetical protein